MYRHNRILHKHYYILELSSFFYKFLWLHINLILDFCLHILNVIKEEFAVKLVRVRQWIAVSS